jgi:hypothetical protein
MLSSAFLLVLHLVPQAIASVRGPTLEDLSNSQFPQRTIAGVQVIDTPIVRAAQQLALNHSEEWAYKHVMRSWLYGALIIGHNATLRDSVDLEAHAIATLIHDIGWDPTPNSTIVSSDKRFEVDGAIAARDFIRRSNVSAQWDDHRVQLVWDAIALHNTTTIHPYKELEVAITAARIGAEAGPILGIIQDEFDAVVEEFPNSDLVDGGNKTMIWLCQTKPLTTVGTSLIYFKNTLTHSGTLSLLVFIFTDNFAQPWGEYFVPNFTVKGYMSIDHALGGDVPDI